MEKQPKIESNIEAEIAKIMALPWWSYGAGIKSEDIRRSSEDSF
jgi:hypothetical protein